MPTNYFDSITLGWGTGAAQANQRELAMNMVTIVDPDEAPTLAVIGKTTTNSLYHDWPIDTLSPVTTAAAPEGADFTAGFYGSATAANASSGRVRIQNYVQRFRKDIGITMDEILMAQRGQTIGVDNYVRNEVGKATKEVQRNINARFWSVASASTVTTAQNNDSGAISATSEFRNFHWFPRATTYATGTFVNSVNANVTAAMTTNQSGAFGTAAFYGLQFKMWQAGIKTNTLFVPGPVKMQVSRTLLADAAPGATAVASTNGLTLAAGGANVINGGTYGPVIDIVRTDYGRVAVVVDRWMPTSGATAASGDCFAAAYYLADRSKMHAAWWRPTQPYNLEPNGDSARVYVLGALTTQLDHPYALGMAYNVTSLT